MKDTLERTAVSKYKLLLVSGQSPMLELIVDMDVEEQIWTGFSTSYGENRRDLRSGSVGPTIITCFCISFEGRKS
jgi:hypothetical protein